MIRMIQMGAPSKYKKEFCQMLITHMSKGLSFECFDAGKGIVKDTLYNWTKKHKAFSDAKKRGELLCQKFWEKMGISGMLNLPVIYNGKLIQPKNFNAAIYIFNMKNRFGWTDRHTIQSDDNEFFFSFQQKKDK